MDRQALLHQFPDGCQFHAAPHYGKKQMLEEKIARVLDAVADDGREPDAWETTNIAAAIGCGFGHMYIAGIGYLAKALAEPGTYVISDQYPVPDPGPNALRHLQTALDILVRQAAPAA